MDERPIDVIFLDLGNVVVCFDRRRVAKNLAVHLKRLEAEIDKIINGADGLALMKSLETGGISDLTFLAEMGARLGCKLHPESFWPAWNDIFWKNELVINLLARAQQESGGLRLIAISDTDCHRLAYMIDLSGLKFGGIVASFQKEVGIWKKDSIRPFQVALELVRIPPERCLFIDDILENTRSALSLGIRIHHYETPEKLEDELRRLQLIS